MKNQIKGVISKKLITLQPITVKAMSTNDTNMTLKRITIEDGLSQTSIEYDKISEEHGGSELRLTLTKQLVNLHNGEKSVERIYGEGSEFIIILPIKQK